MMPDYDAIAAKFLAILSPRESERRRANVEQSLRNIFHGHQMGTIFNVDYKDAKDRLSRSVDDAWEYLHDKYRDSYATRTPEGKVLYNLSPIFGLYGCIAAQKKLPKQFAEENPSAQCRADLITFFDATVPLALMVKELKSKVVMGRKPNPEAIARREAQEAKKIIRTCSVCFRPIAIYSNGYIADHGYRLPHQQGKTASCPGQRFRPLEVSSDGLVYMVKSLTHEVADLESQIAASARLASLSRTNFRREVLTFTPASPEWERELKIYRENLASELRHTRSDLHDYERRLAVWQPTPEGKRYSGGKRRHARPSTVGKLNADVRHLLRK
jgi:hypothetical protein